MYMHITWGLREGFVKMQILPSRSEMRPEGLHLHKAPVLLRRLVCRALSSKSIGAMKEEAFQKEKGLALRLFT